MDLQKGIICMKLINIYYEKNKNKFKKEAKYVLLYYKTLNIKHGMNLEDFILYIVSNNLEELKGKKKESGPFATIYNTETDDFAIKTFVLPRDRRCVIEKINSEEQVPPNMCVYVKINGNQDEIRMIRDSGADFTMLSRETRKKYTEKFSHFVLINSSVRPSFYIDKLEMNGYTFHNIIVNKTDMDDCIGQDIATCCKIKENYEKGICKMIPFTTNIKYVCPTIADLGLKQEYIDQLLINYHLGKPIDTCDIIEKIIESKLKIPFEQQKIKNLSLSINEDEIEKLIQEYENLSSK